MLAESILAVGCPEIVPGPDGFFRPVVEVVTKSRTDMAFELDGCHQAAFIHHKQIPQLGWPEVTRQGENSAAQMDGCVIETVGLNQIDDKSCKAVHVLPAGNARSP